MSRHASSTLERDNVGTAQPRDEQLMKAVHDQHAGAVLAYSMRLTHGDRHWAEDVVQETLLRAWKNADKVDLTHQSIRSWLFTVARRLVIDTARRRAARPREVSAAPLETMATADEMDRSLSAMTTAEALATLTPEHRAVIVETYFRGNTAAEAAAVLGVPVGTVKSRAFYALRALRLALEERGVTTPAAA